MGGSISVNDQAIFAKNGNSQYSIRQIQAKDYDSYIKIIGLAYKHNSKYPITFEVFSNTLQLINSYKPYNKILVVVDNHKNEIVGTGRLLIRPTLMNAHAYAGHLEEVSVKGNLDEGKVIFQLLVNTAQDIANAFGCSKISYVNHGSYRYYEIHYQQELNHFNYVCTDDDRKRVSQLISSSPPNQNNVSLASAQGKAGASMQ